MMWALEMFASKAVGVGWSIALGAGTGVFLFYISIDILLMVSAAKRYNL